MVYFFFKYIGLIVRQYCLPNPFEALWPDKAALLNFILGIILVPVSYKIVGLDYTRGENPVQGCILFNLVYICLTGILMVILSAVRFFINNWAVVVITAGGIVIAALAGMTIWVILKRENQALKVKG